MVTLPQIRSYSADHLVEAAPYWQEQADHWPFHTGGTLNDLSTLAWKGQAADAHLEHATQTHTAALAAAAPVALAAELAPAAASDLTALQSRVMTIVEWCLEGGYWVGDDLQLTDMIRSPNVQVYKAREQIENWLQSTLRQAAGDLVAHDTAVAEQLDAHTHALDAVCDDPDYNDGALRRFIGSVAGGALLGGLATGGPGAIVGGGLAGIGDLIAETQRDGPKCK